MLKNPSKTANCDKCKIELNHLDDHFIIFDLKELFATCLPKLLTAAHENIKEADTCWWNQLQKLVGAKNEDLTMTLNTDGAP